jgi:hypothetical protein
LFERIRTLSQNSYFIIVVVTVPPLSDGEAAKPFSLRINQI